MPRTPTRSRPVTLRDVAHKANVSLAAASLALSGAAVISPETKERVRVASAAMNYRPLRRRALIASAEGERPVRRIGLVLITPYDADSSAMELFQRLDPLGVSLRLKLELAVISETDVANRHQRLKEAARDVDGLLLVGYVDRELIEYASSLGPPCVLLGSVQGEPMHPRPACCIVASDMLAMGYFATESLIKAGHRRIGFFCREIPQGLWYERWLTGYRYAHFDAGLPLDDSLVRLTGMDQSETVGAVASRAVLAMANPPTAYVLPDPYIASSFIERMAAAGKPLARQQVVISANAEQLHRCGVASYPLVMEDSDGMARTVMRLLRQTTDGKAPLACSVAPPFLTRNMELIEGGAN